MRSPIGDEVVAVILAENRAFWMKDAEAFERFHLKEEASIRWGYFQGGGFFIRRGWSQIGPRSLDHMRRLPRPAPEFADAPISNLVVRTSGGMAWATFDKSHPYVPELRGLGPNGNSTHNLRILERHDGKWLIAASGLLDAALGEECVVRLGGDGTILWKSMPAACKLGSDEHFVVSAGRLRLRQRALNARFSEMIAWAVAFDSQFMPRRGSLPLHLETETSVPRVVWISADLDSAIVFLEDRRPVDDRITIASQAFRFSPAQTRLALAVCRGGNLKHYAANASISTNTARTHLKRMFEKTGVASQISLARLLLSFSPPR